MTLDTIGWGQSPVAEFGRAPMHGWLAVYKFLLGDELVGGHLEPEHAHAELGLVVDERDPQLKIARSPIVSFPPYFLQTVKSKTTGILAKRSKFARNPRRV